MSDSTFDISRFLSDNDKVINKDMLEFILTTPTPILNNSLESFLELPLNDNYVRCQLLKKTIAAMKEEKEEKKE
jgi:hypothetical protein